MTTLTTVPAEFGRFEVAYMFNDQKGEPGIDYAPVIAWNIHTDIDPKVNEITGAIGRPVTFHDILDGDDIYLIRDKTTGRFHHYFYPDIFDEDAALRVLKVLWAQHREEREREGRAAS